MRKSTNVGILAKVTAQYFFYKVYFLYLLYILCIGFVTGRDVYVVGHTGTDAETTSSCEMLLIRVHRTDVDSVDCRLDSTECRRMLQFFLREAV